jgi:protein-S-isoprenylcysteine O-methyltransferase Ste14
MMVASAFCVVEPFFAQFFAQLRANLAWFVVGTALAVVGLLIRVWAMRALGGRYVLTPVAQPGKGTLVTRGPYRYVRHPGYLGLYLYFLGLGLMLSPLVGLVGEVPLVALGALRILGEERVLTKEFGVSYANYKVTSRWRVIPWLY